MSDVYESYDDICLSSLMSGRTAMLCTRRLWRHIAGWLLGETFVFLQKKA